MVTVVSRGLGQRNRPASRRPVAGGHRVRCHGAPRSAHGDRPTRPACHATGMTCGFCGSMVTAAPNFMRLPDRRSWRHVHQGIHGTPGSGRGDVSLHGTCVTEGFAARGRSAGVIGAAVAAGAVALMAATAMGATDRSLGRDGTRPATGCCGARAGAGSSGGSARSQEGFGVCGGPGVHGVALGTPAPTRASPDCGTDECAGACPGRIPFSEFGITCDIREDFDMPRCGT